MAKKGGKLRTIILLTFFIALLAIIFILVGGDKVLKTAGKKIEGVGKQAEEVKTKIEEKASSTGKTVEKVIDTVTSGDKK